jgi:hypothetical protein
MQKKVLSLGLGVLLLTIPAISSADSRKAVLDGYSKHPTSPAGQFTNNEDFKAYVVLGAEDVDEPWWYPFDWPAKEYTAVLDGEVLFALDDSDGAFNQSVSFKPNGSCHIYEDTTPDADYANTATFTDGTNILIGQVNNMQGTRLDLNGHPWSITGEITLIGGTGLANLLGCAASGLSLSLNDYAAWQLPNGQPLPGIPAGYKERYGAEWKCLEPTSVEGSSWGGVKALYR